MTDGESVLSLTVIDYPIRAGCHDTPGDAYSIAIFPTIRFPVYSLMDSGRLSYRSLFNVGLLDRRTDSVDWDLTVRTAMRDDLPEWREHLLSNVETIPSTIALFGCRADLDYAMTGLLEYAAVLNHENQAVLVKRPDL
jgi:hypothetical protein